MGCYYSTKELNSWAGIFENKQATSKLKLEKQEKLKKDYFLLRQKQFDLMEIRIKNILIKKLELQKVETQQTLKFFFYDPLNLCGVFFFKSRLYLWYLYLFFGVKKTFLKFQSDEEFALFLKNQNQTFFEHEDRWNFIFNNIRLLFSFQLVSSIHEQIFAPTILKILYLKLAWGVLLPNFFYDLSLLIKRFFLFINLKFVYTLVEVFAVLFVYFVTVIICLRLLIKFVTFMKNFRDW